MGHPFLNGLARFIQIAFDCPRQGDAGSATAFEGPFKVYDFR
jgi:hypothetical protein